MIRRNPLFRLLFSLLAASLAAGSAAAQVTLEEVVVTAQKRSESLQDVPISMEAFTGDALDDLGIQSAEEVLKLIPNAGTVPQGGGKQNFFIRGVGTADFHLNVVGAVGVFLDDVALNNPFSVSFSTFDMERVEVLRGPQNTLFGRNTTGGAVNYISRKPEVGGEVNGYIKGGIGSYDQIDLEGAVGFPLGDKAAARISVVSNERDGVFNNRTTGEDVGSRQSQAARAQVLMQPNDAWELLLNVHGGISRGDPQPFKNVGFLDPNNLTAPCAVPLDDIIPQNNPNCADSSGFVHQYDDWEDVYGNLKHRENADAWGASLRATWDAGAYTLTSVTSFDSLDVEYNEDSDGAPTAIFQFYQEGEYSQWSQELRIASPEEEDLRWIAGAYYFSEDADYATLVRRTPAPLAPSGPPRFNITPNTIVQQDNKVFSLFGQLEYDFSDRLTGTFGFRWTSEEKEGTNAASVRCVGPFGGPPFCPPAFQNQFLGLDDIPNLPALFDPPVEILGEKWKEWGARFALDYRLSDDALLFASASRGFKGGGFSIAALQALLGLAAQDVDPETLWSYELGIKSDLMDGALRLNAAVFYYDWEDLQSFQVLVDPASGVGVPQLTNVPESSLLGGEIEVTWVPADGWYLQAGLGFLDSEIDDAGTIAGVQDGNVIPNTPDVTFTGLIRREFQLEGGLLALQTNFRYRDDVTYDLANAKNLSQEGFWNLNARASYAFGENNRYEVSVWGENLTEEEYCNGMTSLAGLSESNLCLPALSESTFGVTATIQFE